ncbi:protein of unknown function [Acidithiobacillus ferrivorans]|uniref:Uncharacterized protein n=1 Tax=Acidithiobacillus ferrivorans TaxID=160808 RepID=A0A060UP84_9PROT|nr:hypothetical protein AFERRI_100048 [Acidithiobacillus ferrivorans]SMH66816.1 protein of unknown function [Acidithiobacillus ferrivorans]
MACATRWSETLRLFFLTPVAGACRGSAITQYLP